MDASDNERYLRYLLLLGEGGLLVLRGIVLKEVSKRGQTLHAILSNNRSLLSNKIMNQLQFRHIYPTSSSVDADISTWDINLLGMVIVHVFGTTLGQKEITRVREIYDRRVEISENESRLSMEMLEYTQKRLQLTMTLLNLAAETDFNTHSLCLDSVSATGAAPYSIHTLLETLASLCEYKNEMMETLFAQLDTDEDFNADSKDLNDGAANKRTHSFSYSMPDLHNENWYFGPLSRDEANEILEHADTNGAYLIRDCQSNPGNFVLCVKVHSNVSHYLIRRVFVNGIMRYHIGEGDKTFESLSAIIEFYSTHYLDQTSLTDPAPRQQFCTKSDFQGNGPKDLSFKKGEVLEIISKEEEKWWYAKNAGGKIGIVPVLYLTRIQDADNKKKPKQTTTDAEHLDETSNDVPPSVPKRLPAKAMVTKARISNPYDKSQLTLHEGDIVIVTKMFANGHWQGECKGKSGMFPYRHVTFVDDL